VARVGGRRRFEDNPFHVLGLPPSATRAEIEREGQKLLAMLELGLASAATYATPVGRAPRTPDKVRGAMAELRDPEKRISHELWARLAPAPAGEEPAERAAAAPSPRRWPDARRALGFGGRR
jgi:hypothetical protein